MRAIKVLLGKKRAAHNGRSTPEARGVGRIDITVRLKIRASGGSALREKLARAVVVLKVLAAAAVTFTVATGATGGGNTVRSTICRVATMLFGASG